MKALLLAGYILENRRDTLSALSMLDSGQLWIDHQIELLQRYGFEVTVVVGGPESEAILRGSRLLEQCELVYDTNDEHRTILTNLRAGLHTVIRHCFVLPIQKPCPERVIFQASLRQYFTSAYSSKAHVVWPAIQGQWPALITPIGRRFLLRNDDIQDLYETRVLAEQATLKPITSQVINSESALSDWTG